MKIFGIHLSNDSFACVTSDGRIIAAALKKRFSLVKNDSNFPINSINFCLKESGINSKDSYIIAIIITYIEREHKTFLNLPNVPTSKRLKGRLRLKIQRKISDFLKINKLPNGNELPIYTETPEFSKS